MSIIKKGFGGTSVVPPHFDMNQVAAQTKKLFLEVKFKELEHAPLPIFWFGMASLLPMCGPPLASILFGYSHLLAVLQVKFAATLCAFLGGLRMGYIIKEGKEITWEETVWNVIPSMCGWLGALLPIPLAVLVIAKGFALSAYHDLTIGSYPPWLRAFRLAFTIPALLGLFITLLARLFF